MENVLLKILSFIAPSQAGHLVPAFVGPTGGGKTSRVLAAAKTLNLPEHRLLLGTMLAEDILGLPRVVRGRTTWSLPEWAAEAAQRPVLLFLDELDKARPDCLSAVLTLLAERRVRDVRIHPETRIVAAMQPVEPDAWLSDETGRALSARLVFLPTPYDWGWLGSRVNLDLSPLPAPMVQTPILQSPSPRQVEWAVAFARSHWSDQPLVKVVFEGLFTQSVASWLLETIEHALTTSAVVTPKDIVMAANKDVATIERLAPAEIIGILADVWQFGRPETIRKALVRVWSHCGPDELQAALKGQYDELSSRIDAAGGELDICDGAEETEVVDALEAAASDIAAIWRARKKSEE